MHKRDMETLRWHGRRKRITCHLKKGMNDLNHSDDTYDLARFVQAQEGVYEQALAEIRNGRKRSHWMWYIFPQFDGLASSSTSQRYSIKSIAEAKAYLDHPLLG